jgi:hypothetical protein
MDRGYCGCGRVSYLLRCKVVVLQSSRKGFVNRNAGRAFDWSPVADAMVGAFSPGFLDRSLQRERSESVDLV